MTAKSNKELDSKLEYYQSITKDGLVDNNITPQNVVSKDNRKLYNFIGSVYRFDKCAIGAFRKSTLAISEKQAISNIIYSAKRILKLEPSAGGFKLVGTLKAEEESNEKKQA